VASLALAAALLLEAGAGSFSASELDSALQVEARAGFSGVVRVARDDSVRFEKAYGAAAAAGQAAADLPFWIASDTKQFTAAAILRLQERGRLSVTDPITRFFPGTPPDKRAITVHQLLTHTSGLPSAFRADGIVDRDRAVAAILRLGLRSRPGEKHSYSNDGYVLLAAVVEIASEVPFDSYLADSLFAPAGLARTGLWGHEPSRLVIAPLADPAQARRRRSHVYRDGRSVANWGYRGPTGAYSTARDLHAWVEALRGGAVLGPAARAALVGRHVLVRSEGRSESFAAYGWGVRVEDGRDVAYGHTGGEDWLGHSSVLRWTPEGECVVVLANSGDFDGTGWASRANRAVRAILDRSRSGAP
jgi:CubicO group peptidase (beta-lactamase class C family)